MPAPGVRTRLAWCGSPPILYRFQAARPSIPTDTDREAVQPSRPWLPRRARLPWSEPPSLQRKPARSRDTKLHLEARLIRAQAEAELARSPGAAASPVDHAL